MSITLTSIIIGLLVVLYVWSLYIEWHQLTHPQPDDAINLVEMLNDIKRDARKSIYFTERTLGVVQNATTKTVKKVFLKVFPKARDAFKNQDKLTGLTSGPSSYFLNELSDTSVKKTSRRVKKSMQ